MKIAVCGSGSVTNKEIAKKAFEIGKEIAENGVLLLTGSGTGYPYEAVKGAKSANGRVFGISPAKSKEEHVGKYFFPIEGFTKIEYTGLGIPGRNYPLVEKADAIIIISGQTGSLNEFTIAFHYSKVIGGLKNSGGIISIIKEIADICDKKGESKNIVYSEDPKELVTLVIDKLKNK